ncbi:polysaccharide deacetylase family protein [Lyngbya aestuarii]|uniref:polysaccharide deacetylase family protein n=1 Tax=Lyngbya aestuarii TaxID=118322 RepID=UPI00403DBB2E
MTYSNALYQPSVLELARNGNCQALTYWLNSFLVPKGTYVRVEDTPSGDLQISVYFHKPQGKKLCLSLRTPLVRFICYRLWTLNSEWIGDVKIVARLAGVPQIIWKQSVRISTPANAQRLRQPRQLSLRNRKINWLTFQIIRSLFLSNLAFASLLIGLWLPYFTATSYQTTKWPFEIVQTNAPATDQFDYLPAQEILKMANKELERLRTLVVTVPEQFQGEIIYQVKPVGTEKVVALTFDDGPWPNTTSQVLDILKKNDIKATFFLVGKHLKRYPEAARRIAAEGHIIGNHTWSHMTHDLDELTAAREIENAGKLIYEVTGVKTSLFRPPGGHLGGGIVPYAKKQKYATMMWSADSKDYLVSAPILIDNVLSRVESGGIVLLHDGGGNRRATVEALPQIISALQQRGYKFVTVPELLEMQAEPQQVPLVEERNLAPEASVPKTG